jgi:hypothetical protein
VNFRREWMDSRIRSLRLRIEWAAVERVLKFILRGGGGGDEIGREELG